MNSPIPTPSYGVLQKTVVQSPVDEAVEQVRTLGYAALDAGLSANELAALTEAFERTRATYIEKYGEERLRQAHEYHTVRALLTHAGEWALTLAMNKNLHAALGQLIAGKYILNQQNGVVNPPQETYNQGSWHRDLPYQHFVSNRPIAVNALFCIDPFTQENGATFVLPASHKSEPYPSDEYRARNAVQVAAPAGHFLLLDCMLFHAGGFNRTTAERRAINHVFTIPYFKQQINLPNNLEGEKLSPEARELLGFHVAEPASIEAYLATRSGKGY